MKTALIAILCFVLSGCGASMVSTRGDSKSAYAPTNEKDARIGTVKYLNEGFAGAKKKRREAAYRKASQYCKGPYKINSEGPNSEGGAAISPSPWGAVYSSSQYWYINFQCE